MQVVWCDDVKRGELTQPHAPKLGVADTLAHAQSTAERSRIVASLLHLTGFSTFAYFALEFAHERVESLYLHEAFTPATYRGDYVRHNHHDIDPRTLGARVQHADRVGPAAVAPRTPRARRRPACDAGRARRLPADDARRRNVQRHHVFDGRARHAAACVHELHRAAPHARMDHAGDDRAGAVDRAVGAQVRVAAADLDVARTRGERLTPFEQELLLGIAEGASDKEIGRRLDTSAHNVDYHLRKLRKRFGVANRIQLTYLTSKLELI